MKLDVKVRRGGKTRRQRYEEQNRRAAIVEIKCVWEAVSYFFFFLFLTVVVLKGGRKK